MRGSKQSQVKSAQESDTDGCLGSTLFIFSGLVSSGISMRYIPQKQTLLVVAMLPRREDFALKSSLAWLDLITSDLTRCANPSLLGRPPLEDSLILKKRYVRECIEKRYVYVSRAWMLTPF